MARKRVITIMSIVIAVVTLALIVLLQYTGSRNTFKFRGSYKCSDCNVVLISIDTLRADHLGCYGYKRQTSGNIDEFARDAVLFQETIVQAPSTLPSHASIFTSLIPSHHGAFIAKKTGIVAEAETISEILQREGYRTVSYNGGVQMAGEFGFNRGFEVYDSFNENFIVHVDRGIDWLKRNKNEKFFLFLHTYEVHHPYTPKKEYLDLFEDEYLGNLPMDISIPLLREINNKKIVIDQKDREHIINTYDAEIYSMDKAFGMLIEFLKAEDLYDNTIIIFTSDHGEEFGEHEWMGWHSHTLYDELLKVPLIIKFPHSKYSGRVIKEQVRSIDILPTLLDIVDIEISKNVEGVSLINFNSNEELFAVSQQDTEGDRHPTSIRTKKWKLYDSTLYHLVKDPLETHEVSNPEMEEYLGYFRALILKKGKIPSVKEAELHREKIRELKALGYIN